MTAPALSQLPVNMRTKIAIEICPVPALPGFCWGWTGCLNSKGYGCVAVKGKSQLTHRVSYSLLVGLIPTGLQIDHLCLNRRCCNPAHLEPVTPKVNVGRAWPAMKPTCVNGHQLSGDNLVIKKRGTGRSTIRNCRTCANDRKRLVAVA